MEAQDVVLAVRDLRTHFRLDEGVLKAVDGVSFDIRQGKVLGVVGESGCGKSVTAHSIMRIVPRPGVVSGEIWMRRDGEMVDLVSLKPGGREIRDVRGRDIGMIFQEPTTAFSPVHTIGDQISEAILIHERVPRKVARARTTELLRQVGVSDPERRLDDLPYRFSGGMRQRAMIAMALALRPKLLIADEPTTALDVTIQAQILRLLEAIQAEMGMAIMFITHNLGVIANVADEVAVMYLGKIVEFGTVNQIFENPQHPYTQALMRSIPRGRRQAAGRLAVIEGNVPVPIDPPDACPFAGRCPQFIPQVCDRGVPPFVDTEPGHQVRCVLYGEASASSGPLGISSAPKPQDLKGRANN